MPIWSFGEVQEYISILYIVGFALVSYKLQYENGSMYEGCL